MKLKMDFMLRKVAGYYVVVPVLILISLALFAGTVLLIEVCAWLTMLIPAAACYGASRLLRMLDEKFL